jgi:hypothetical protein
MPSSYHKVELARVRFAGLAAEVRADETYEQTAKREKSEASLKAHADSITQRLAPATFTNVSTSLLKRRKQ